MDGWWLEETAENAKSLAGTFDPPLAAGEGKPRPKDPENISGKPPPSDDGRVLNVGVYMPLVGIRDESIESAEFPMSRGDLNKQVDALNKYYKQANVSFQLLDADWTHDDFLADESAFTASRALEFELALGLHKGNI